MEQLPKFLSWMISFVIVCKFWLNHHNLLEFASHANYGRGLAQFDLPDVSVAGAVSHGRDGRVPIQSASARAVRRVMAVNTCAFLALQGYIFRNLLKPEYAGTIRPSLVERWFASAGCYLLGSAAAWVTPYLSFALFILTPLFSITPRRPHKQKHGPSGE